MRRRIVLTLGLFAIASLGLFGVLCWQDVLELWHISRLESREDGVASAAADALVAMKSIRAVPPFLRTITKEAAHPFEGHARKILAALDALAFERLASRLLDEPDELTLLTFKAAQEAGVARNRLVPILRRALGSANPSLCRWACEEAGEVGPDAAALLTEIRAAQRSPDRLVRLWASVAEARIDPSSGALELVEPKNEK